MTYWCIWTLVYPGIMVNNFDLGMSFISVYIVHALG